MRQVVVAAIIVLLLTACGHGPFSTAAGEPPSSFSPVSESAVDRPTGTLTPTAPRSDPPADGLATSAPPVDRPGPARFGLPTVDDDSHLLTYLWTFPGGGAVFRPLHAIPSGVIDPNAAKRALATGAPTPPDGEPFLATHETNIQPPRLVWAIVWTAQGGFTPPPPPPPPGQPSAPPATISIFAHVIDAQTGAPLTLLISSR